MKRYEPGKKDEKEEKPQGLPPVRKKLYGDHPIRKKQWR